MLRKSLVYVLAGVLAYGLLALVMQTATIASASSPTDNAVRAALQQELSKKLPGVRAAVEGRAATLTGTVQSYLDKMKAQQIAHKYSALTRIVNDVQVGGPVVEDQALAQKLASKLAYDRSMQGNIFDWYTIEVRNGAVTLSGYAHNYMAYNDARALVESEKGVKDVVDTVEVLPLSPNDDRIRMDAARRIYTSGELSRYLADPAHPIRIVVRDGNIILEGAVLNSMDRNLAQIAADSTPGAFSVTNNLSVDRKG